MNSFIQKCSQESARFTSFNLVNDQEKDPYETNRKIIASKDILSGQEIAFIPKKLILTEKICNDSIIGKTLNGYLEMHPDLIHQITNNGQYSYGLSVLRMSIYMIYEKFISKSLFFEYVSTLPELYSLTVCWDDEEIERYLHGTNLCHLTMERKKWIKLAFEVAQKACNDLFENHLTFQNVLWAYCAISSRAFPLNKEDRNQICLWPLLDLLNHSNDCKIEWIIDENGVSFIARENISQGAELMNNYGPKGSENLLINYGFVVEDNPHDYYKLTLNMRDPNERLHSLKQELLPTLIPNQVTHMLFMNEVELPKDLIAVLRFFLMNEWECSHEFHQNSISIDSHEFHQNSISLRNELLVYQTLEGLLQEKLSILKKTNCIIEPEKLQSKSASINSAFYRNSQIQILERNLTITQTKSNQIISSRISNDNFIHIDNPHLDSVLLKQIRNDFDEETVLCFMIIHELVKKEDSHWNLASRYPFNPLLIQEILGDASDEIEYFKELESMMDMNVLGFVSMELFIWTSLLLLSNGSEVTGKFGILLTAIFARLLTHPLDTLRIRIQSSSNISHPETIGIMMKEGGITSFYKGLPVATMFSVPALAIYLSSYDYFKSIFPDSSNLLMVHGVSALGAECLSGFFWTPMEIVKSKQQIRSGKLKSIIQSIYKESGYKGFLRGYWTSLGVFAPYSMMFFIAYEKLKTLNSSAILNSSASAILAASISNPLDIVKTRVQVSNQHPLDVVKNLYVNEGKIWAFTRGLGARILYITPSVTISISLYEYLKSKIIF